MADNKETIPTNELGYHMVPFSPFYLLADILLRCVILYLFESFNINLWLIWSIQIFILPLTILIIVNLRDNKWRKKMDKYDGFTRQDTYVVDAGFFAKFFTFIVVVCGTIIFWRSLQSLTLWLQILLSVISLLIYSAFIFAIFVSSKSYTKMIKRTLEENGNDTVAIWTIPYSEMKNIFHNKNFENIWGKEPGNVKYTLFLMIYSNEASLWYEDSIDKTFYHCKLRRLIKTGGTYEDGIDSGVYEFEIINLPQLDFSHSPNLSHVGEVFYMDRKRFDEFFVIPLYMEDSYDNQLRNTIGLEDTRFN